jgi:uncharacterized integral membrane protein
MSTDPQFPPVASSHPGPLDPIGPEPPTVYTSAPKPPPPENAVKFTKAAALWSSLIVGFLVLIVLLIFTFLVGAARIVQLRRAAKKNFKAALKAS